MEGTEDRNGGNDADGRDTDGFDADDDGGIVGSLACGRLQTSSCPKNNAAAV